MVSIHTCSLTGTCFLALDWYKMVFRNVWSRLYSAPKSAELCVLRNDKHRFTEKNPSGF